ncbi:MAG: hypothetical protein JWO09_1075 [Bacteroidetes bacterium]|nr:hypothetical protein [Bacteroidota bacterium]
MKLRNYSAFLISFLISIFSASAQSIANYTTVRTTGIAYSSIAATGNAIDSWRNNAGFSQDDNRSNATDIGFDFWYNGARYTQFSVSTNGFIDFSSSALNGGPTAGPYSYNNTAFTSNGSGTWLALAPFYDDMTAQGGTSALGNSIKYLVTGAAPNRVLTVEWINMAVYLNTTPNINFQVKLYETTGVIEFIYGTMVSGTHTFSYTCGINAAVLSNAATAAQLKCQQTANTNTFNNGEQNALVTLPASNSKISFTPPLTTPAASGAVTFTGVTQTSMNVNWTNWCSNEVGYVLYNSTDNVNFSFVTQTAANATTFASTGLSPGTLYYWRVYSVTEGALSNFVTASQTTAAAGTVISIATGNWSNPATWNCACVPAISDNVTIANTHTVTLDVNGNCNNLTVGQGASGILQMGNNATVRTLNVKGNITVNAGAIFRVNAASVATHSLLAAGNLTNNGTLNFFSGTNLCNVTFTKNGNATLSGTGATNNYNKVILNMGASINNTLNVTSSNFTAANNFLTLTNGTFKLSTVNAVTITPYTALAVIPNTAGITLNSALATVNFSNGIDLYGNLIVTNGNLNVGTAVNQNVASNGGVFQVFAGVTRIAGCYYSANINTLSKFTISGGTLTLPTIGSTSTTIAPFQIDGVGSTYNMSGGTIIIEREGGAGPQNLGCTITGVSNSAVTGGTLQIGNASTPAAQVMNVNSSSRVGNLTVNSSNATCMITTNPLTVTQNVNILLGVLNANNLGISLGGNWTNNSTFTPGTGTVTFNGTSPQTIGGSVVTAYRNLTISDATGVTLALNTSVAGVLNFTAGVINTGVNNVIITATGSVTGAATGRFVNGFLQKNVATGTNVARTYEIGSGSSDYLPVSLNFASVSVAGNVTAKVNNGDHPNIATSCLDPAKSVNHYWQLSNAGTTFTSYSATCNFLGVPTDADAGSVPANYFMSVYNAGAWTMLTQGTVTATSNQATGITLIGDLQVAEKKLPVITTQPASVTVCNNTVATFSVAATGTSLTYQWQQNNGGGFVNLANGGIYSGVTTATLTLTNATTPLNTYQYRCIVSASCGSSVTSTNAILTVTPSVAASVSISASATTICAGTSVTFTATPTNGGTTPVYQWKVNGVNAGLNSPTFTTTTLASGNVVTCVMTSNAACVTGSPATSNSITMTVNPNLPVSVSISASSTTICPGTSVTFTATPTNGGTTPAYQWKKNGVNIGGATSSTYTSSTLTNGNVITCVLTSNALCATGSPATSNAITIIVNSSIPVSVSISASPSNVICAGTSVTFTAVPVNGGTSPVYQWKLNGANVGVNSPTYTNAALANGNVVTCVMTSVASCGTGSPATSNAITMTVNPNVPVSVSISASPAGTICAGTSVTFTATPTNGGTTPAYQWKVNGANVGTNSPTYTSTTLANGNIVTCVLTSSAACTTGSPATSNSITMTVTPGSPVSISVSASPSSTICAGTNVTFTATPTNGGGAPVYQWKLNGANVGINSTTYSNAALANGDIVTCVLTSNAVCATGNPATSPAINMTVNPNLPVSVSISASPSGSACAGTSITYTAAPVNGGTTPAYQWKVNGGNVGINASTYTSSSMNNGDVITCVLTSNATCATGSPATSNAITQVITVAGTWLGAISNDWDDPLNWCGGVPAATTNVSVTSGTPFSPMLTGGAACKNLTLGAGTVLDLNNNDLSVSGTFAGTGVMTGSLTSSLTIIGAGTGGTFNMDQSSPGTTNIINSISLNRAGATVTMGNSTHVTGTVNVISGTLATGSNLTLISDASGTARVAALAAGADVTGNVTMQRYIPGGTDGWMFLCAPVSGATLAQWDDDFPTGGFPGSAYPPSPNPSIVSYNEALPGIYDDGYVSPTNITNPIADRKGYWAYIVGTPVTVDVTGPILKNLQTFPVTYNDDPYEPAIEDGWNLISNPYPSTIDWDAAGWTKTNINDAIYMYSPTLDQYTSYVGGIGINGGSNYIASSQAFLVQSYAAGPVLKLTETAKDATDGLFIRASSASSDDLLRLNLSGNGYTDETVIHFNGGASNNFDLSYDAMKFFSFNPDVPGIATVLDTVNLSVNTYPLLSNLSIPVNVRVGVSGTYTIHLDSLSRLPAGACIVMQDLLTGTQTDLRTTSTYSFYIMDTTLYPRFVINISQPVQTASAPSSCSGNPNGMASATGNGSGPWDYTWQDASGTVVQTHTGLNGPDTLSNISAGVYTVTISGNPGLCNVMNGLVEVTGADSIDVVTNTVDGSCSGSPDGGILLVSASGGVPPYSYSWSNGVTTADNTNIAPGVYILDVTDSTGCIQENTYTVAQGSSLLGGFTVNYDTVDLASGIPVAFTNTSAGGTSFTWNFGDGTTADYSENPSYYYKEEGVYTVTMIVSDGNCTDTVTQVIVVISSLPPTPTGIGEQNFNEGISIGTNETTIQVLFNLESSADVSVEVMNSLGQQVFERRTASVYRNSISYDFSSKSKGVYFIKIRSGNGVMVVKKVVRS